MDKDVFAETYGVSEKEIWEHYGYDMEKIHAEGGFGIWPREKAFENLKGIADFVKFVDKNKKARIVFEYDPDFPAAVITTAVTLNV